MMDSYSVCLIIFEITCSNCTTKTSLKCLTSIDNLSYYRPHTTACATTLATDTSRERVHILLSIVTK